MKKVLVIIPAYNPPIFLKENIDKLNNKGYEVVVVDDGSKVKTALTDLSCKVLTLNKNRGKGIALKKAFNYYLENYDQNEYSGVITLDANEKYVLEDLETMQQEMEVLGGIVIGKRVFEKEMYRLGQRISLKTTSFLMKLFYGQNLKDIRSGAKCISNEALNLIVKTSGSRFEYETHALVDCVNANMNVSECDLRLYYTNDKNESSYHHIKDSVLIYAVLLSRILTYLMSSVSSYAIDITMFTIIVWLLDHFASTHRIFIATVGARIISSIFNYNMNRRVVFKSNEKAGRTVWKYYLLCICEMTLSATLVSAVYKLIPLSETLTKVVVDACLFVVSFFVQNKIIFKK